MAELPWERLRRERDAARKEVERLTAKCAEWIDRHDELLDEADAARAEAERLLGENAEALAEGSARAARIAELEGLEGLIRAWRAARTADCPACDGGASGPCCLCPEIGDRYTKATEALLEGGA